MFYKGQKRRDSMILLVDFEKAFDNLALSSIGKLLKYFNFEKKFKSL